METWILAAIGAAALGYIGRVIWRSIQGTPACGCDSGKCSGDTAKNGCCCGGGKKLP